MKVGVEEHITYTIEPSGDYLTHTVVPPNKGTGRDLADNFRDIIAENKSLESLLAVVADGTAVNTGWKDGLISHLERDLQCVLLRLVCQLHGNELLLCHLFVHCDGGHGTSGPDSFKGPIGSSLKGDIHLSPVVNFNIISITIS